jgi:hypothetical protein
MELCTKDILIQGKLVRVGRIDGENYRFLADPADAIKVLQRSHKRIDLFTFVQSLSDTTPRFPFWMEWDNLAALEVRSFDDWMTSQIDFKTRNKVRKAEKKGIVVREVEFDEALVRGISGIYNEVPVRQGMPFWHYAKDLEAVRSINATFMERSVFIGAFCESKLVGFVKMVANEDWSQAGLMQILSMIEYRDKAPTNALVAQAVKSCAARGIRHLFYANFTFGNKQADSLADFKRHNGFQKVDIPRYYVGLTVVGKAALRLGLHRSAIEWAPAPMIAAYRKARAAWLARGIKVTKAPSLEES